jgi:hypothetical protein
MVYHHSFIYAFGYNMMRYSLYVLLIIVSFAVTVHSQRGGGGHGGGGGGGHGDGSGGGGTHLNFFVINLVFDNGNSRLQ